MNLKVLLTKILELITTPVKTATYKTGDITVPAYKSGAASMGSKTGTHSFSAISGYTPVGVLSYTLAGTNNSLIRLLRCETSGTTMYYAMANNKTSAATVTISYMVLYVKNGLLG